MTLSDFISLGSARLRKVVFDDEIGENLTKTERMKIRKLKKQLEV